MSYIIGRFKTDLDKWKEVIESDKKAHNDAGLHFQRVWRNIDDPKEIFFLFEVDDVSKARGFLQNAGALDKDKAKKGEIPELVFVETA